MRGQYIEPRILCKRYAVVMRYKDFDICTLKVCVPSEGDTCHYAIDDDVFCGRKFEEIKDAMAAIDALFME